MSKIIIAGDKHVRSQEPFYLALKDYFNWFTDQEWNNKNNYYIDLGDIFHKSLPDPKSNELVLHWFEKMKFKKIYCIHGNHEYDGRRKMSALQILSKFNNVEIIYNKKVLDIEGLKCLCLPFYYPSQNNETMYESYNNLIDKEYDYIFGHIENENQHFGNYFIDLSDIKGKQIHGHIHIPYNEFLGVPVISRYDEKNIKPKMSIIEIKNKSNYYIDVPKYIDYYNFDYPEDLEFKVPYPIFTINNVIDSKSVKDYYITKYKDRKLYFRSLVRKKEKIEVNENNEENENLSIEEHFKNFFENHKNIDDVKKICYSYYK